MEDIKEFTFIKEYKGKKIVIIIFDYYTGEERLTKLVCKYEPNSITLVNASNEQLINEVDNFFRNAMEVIDSKSFIKRIKGLFK